MFLRSKQSPISSTSHNVQQKDQFSCIKNKSQNIIKEQEQKHSMQNFYQQYMVLDVNASSISHFFSKFSFLSKKSAKQQENSEMLYLKKKRNKKQNLVNADKNNFEYIALKIIVSNKAQRQSLVNKILKSKSQDQISKSNTNVNFQQIIYLSKQKSLQPIINYFVQQVSTYCSSNTYIYLIFQRWSHSIQFQLDKIVEKFQQQKSKQQIPIKKISLKYQNRSEVQENYQKNNIQQQSQINKYSSSSTLATLRNTNSPYLGLGNLQDNLPQNQKIYKKEKYNSYFNKQLAQQLLKIAYTGVFGINALFYQQNLPQSLKVKDIICKKLTQQKNQKINYTDIKQQSISYQFLQPFLTMNAQIMFQFEKGFQKNHLPSINYPSPQQISSIWQNNLSFIQTNSNQNLYCSLLFKLGMILLQVWKYYIYLIQKDRSLPEQNKEQQDTKNDLSKYFETQSILHKCYKRKQEKGLKQGDRSYGGRYQDYISRKSTAQEVSFEIESISGVDWLSLCNQLQSMKVQDSRNENEKMLYMILKHLLNRSAVQRRRVLQVIGSKEYEMILKGLCVNVNANVNINEAREQSLFRSDGKFGRNGGNDNKGNNGNNLTTQPYTSNYIYQPYAMYQNQHPYARKNQYQQATLPSPTMYPSSINNGNINISNNCNCYTNKDKDKQINEPNAMYHKVTRIVQTKTQNQEPSYQFKSFIPTSSLPQQSYPSPHHAQTPSLSSSTHFNPSPNPFSLLSPSHNYNNQPNPFTSTQPSDQNHIHPPSIFLNLSKINNSTSNSLNSNIKYSSSTTNSYPTSHLYNQNQTPSSNQVYNKNLYTKQFFHHYSHFHHFPTSKPYQDNQYFQQNPRISPIFQLKSNQINNDKQKNDQIKRIEKVYMNSQKEVQQIPETLNYQSQKQRLIKLKQLQQPYIINMKQVKHSQQINLYQTGNQKRKSESQKKLNKSGDKFYEQKQEKHHSQPKIQSNADKNLTTTGMGQQISDKFKQFLKFQARNSQNSQNSYIKIQQQQSQRNSTAKKNLFKQNIYALQSNQKSNQNNAKNQNQVSNQLQQQYTIKEYLGGARYEGYLKNGKRNGYGKFYYQEGSLYDGQWKDDRMSGYGKLYYNNGQIAYEGDWVDDEFHGNGKVHNDSPTMLDDSFDYTNFNNLQEQWVYYEGQLQRDLKEGHGILMLENGEWFEGQFHKDRINGKGKFVNIQGDVIEGIWKNSIMVERFED